MTPATPHRSSDLNLDLLFEVVQIHLADRIAQNLPTRDTRASRMSQRGRFHCPADRTRIA